MDIPTRVVTYLSVRTCVMSVLALSTSFTNIQFLLFLLLLILVAIFFSTPYLICRVSGLTFSNTFGKLP